MQLYQDRICGGGALEGPAAGVVRCDEVIDTLYELFDASERATADGFEPPRFPRRLFGLSQTATAVV